MLKMYPRWITRPDGAKVIVKDHLQHSASMGCEYGTDAQPVTSRPKPPSLETVMAAGYGTNAATFIVENEKAKFDQGIEPYGDRPFSEFVPPVEPEPPALSSGIEPQVGDVFTIAGKYVENPETSEPISETIIPAGEFTIEPTGNIEPAPKNKGGRPRKVNP